MKIQNTFIALFIIILLAVSLYGLPSSDHRLVLTDSDIDDSPIIRREADLPGDAANTSINTTIPETTTITTPTTSTTSSDTTTTTTTSPTDSTSTASPTATTTITEPPTPSSTTTESPTPPPTTTVAPIITESPTTSAPGRKFDGLSFFGGIILAVGLGVIIYLVIGYLRRNNQLPYSNLR